MTDTLDKKNSFKADSLKRIELYNKTQSEESFCLNEVPVIFTEKDFVKKEEKNKTVIHSLFSNLKGRKIGCYLNGSNKKVFCNLVYFINNDNTFIINNIYKEFFNKKMPNTLNIKIDKNGKVYDFSLNIKENHSENSLVVSLPDNVTITFKRGCERFVDYTNKTIAIYLTDYKKEFIGKITDISESGICLYFDELIIDNNSLSNLYDLKGSKIPFIIDSDSNYKCFNMKIVYIHHSRDEKIIKIGGNIIFKDEKEISTIKNIVSEIEKDSLNAERISTSIKHIIETKQKIR